MHTFDESYFDAGLDRRGTRSEKWDGTEKESVLPLWVADMDFPSPPEVAEAIAVRALHPTYGYTLVLPDDTRALTGFWQRPAQSDDSGRVGDDDPLRCDGHSACPAGADEARATG